MYGQLSHAAEPNSASEPSPVATNDDGLEGVGFASNRISDDADDDDPFSKRRYDNLVEALNFFSMCAHILLLSFFLFC